MLLSSEQGVIPDRAGETVENDTTVSILCDGICLPTLTSITNYGTVLSLSGRLHLSQQVPNQPFRGRYWIWPYVMSDLWNATTHVRKDRDLKLFAALNDDVQSQLAPSKSRIKLRSRQSM